MRNYTNSQSIEHHDDGSRTVTTVETIEPVTRKQQAIAGGVLGLLVLAPVMPILAVAIYDRIEEKRLARKNKKLSKKDD